MKNCLFYTALLFASLQLGFSQTLTNTFFFGPPLTPVWDISGIYQITNQMESATIGPLDIVFNQLGLGVDAQGKVRPLGSPTILVLVGKDVVGGDYKVSGRISGGGAITHVNLSIKFNGNGIVAGLPTTCSFSARYNLEIYPTNAPTLAGRTSGTAHFSHLGSGSFKSNISLPLPPGADGGWNVTLDMVAFGNRLFGTAVALVDTSTGEATTTLATKANGTVSQSGLAKVNLTGYGNSVGTRLNLEFTPVPGATNVLATVNGKVLGQKVKS
jgi:hypothetical protein